MPLMPVNFKCSSELRPTLIFAMYETFRQQNGSAESPELLADFLTAYRVVSSGHVVYLQASRVAPLMELLSKLGADIGALDVTLAERSPDDEEEF